ncbi:MAG: hypothetical protein ACOH1Y_00820 [Propionicimonas sp.]
MDAMTGRSMIQRALRFWPWLAVAVIISLVVGLGGFAKRTDNLTPVELGTEIDSHNLVFTISGATLQKVANFGGGNEWSVEASGSVRNPNDEALYPILGPTGNFVVHDRASGLTADANSALVGDSRNRELVPPGNTSLPLTISFTLPEEYVPQEGIELAIAQMEYTDNVVLGLGGGQKAWNVDSYAPLSLLQVPLTRLADKPA